MIKPRGIFLLLLLFPHLLFAQVKSVADFRQSLIGRFNFLGLADVYDNNLSIGAEYRFNEHWSTGTDVAYIYYSAYKYNNKGASGFIARPFIRYYPEKDRRGFIELELHYKHASYKLERWVGRDVVNGVPSYEELAMVDFDKKAWGFHFKAGTSAKLSSVMEMEFYMGIGSRWKKQGFVPIENTSITPIRTTALNDAFNSPDYKGVVLPMGVRLLFKLNKK